MIKIATHNGKFHSDDVFAVAILFIALGKDNCEVVRTREEDVIMNGDIVVDVGGEYNSSRKRFDHHQLGGAGKRGDGIPYASAGLVWNDYGIKVAGSDKVKDEIDRILIKPIDALDNGVEISKSLFNDLYSFDVGSVVNLYRLTWKENGDWDERFLKAVDWAMMVLKRLISVTKDILDARSIVEKAYKDSTNKIIIIIDEKYNLGREVVMDTLFLYSEPIYALLYRADINNWQIIAIRKTEGSFASRKPFPESWRALVGEDLQKITGIRDSVFCHRSGFMCVAGSKEGAVALAEKALRN